MCIRDRAWTGKSELLFAIAVIADDITAAFATVAFVAFISLLVDRTYTATQYALLASVGTAGRTTLASSSGALVDWLNGDWGTFFVLTTIMVIPSLIFLWMIKNKIYFAPILTLFLIIQRHISEGITIIVVKTKNVPQSPFNQSTKAPDLSLIHI